MNFTRKDIYIANMVKCRPPDNRDPLPEEMEACNPYLINSCVGVANSLGDIDLGGKANDELKAMLAKLEVTNEELKMLVNAGGASNNG